MTKDIHCLRWYEKATENRSKIWQETLTTCDYNVVAFRQAYLDTRKRIRNKQDNWKLDSDWKEASAVSDETFVDFETKQEEEDFTKFEKERQSYDQDQNSNAKIHNYLESFTFAQKQLNY